MGKASLKPFKAWPILLLIAFVYWLKENMAISDISDLNSRSDALLPILLGVMAIAGTLLFLKLLLKPKKKEEKPQFSDISE
jgi:hypothetical protein